MFMSSKGIHRFIEKKFRVERKITIQKRSMRLIVTLKRTIVILIANHTELTLPHETLKPAHSRQHKHFLLHISPLITVPPPDTTYSKPCLGH